MVGLIIISIAMLALLPMVFLDNYLVPSLRQAVSGGIGSSSDHSLHHGGSGKYLDHTTQLSNSDSRSELDSGLISASSSSALQHHAPPYACKCPGFSANAIQNAIKRANHTVFLEIRRPKKSFHSNHWFHMGEYFISLHGNTYLRNMIHKGDTILLMAHDASFVKHMTAVSAYWLLLGINGDSKQRASRLEVYEPTWVYQYRQEHENALSFAATSAPTSTWGSFESHGPSFVYDSTIPRSSDRFYTVDMSVRAGGGGIKRRRGRGRRRSEAATDTGTDTGVEPEAEIEREEGRQCMCGRYFPHLGAQPTPSTRWFQSEDQVKELRTHAADVCKIGTGTATGIGIGRDKENGRRIKGEGEGSGVGLNIIGQRQEYKEGDVGGFVAILGTGTITSTSMGTTTSTTKVADAVPTTKTFIGMRPKKKRFLLTVYERNNNRHFVDLEHVLSQVVHFLTPTTSIQSPQSQTEIEGQWEVRLVTHDENMSPCILHDTLRQTDVYLTTHGFQVTAVLLLPPGATVIEIYPYKYYKSSYVDLTKQLRINHIWSQNTKPTTTSREMLRLVSQEWCMSINRCRTHARGDNVLVTEAQMKLIYNTLKSVEKGVYSAPGPIAVYSSSSKT